MLKYKYILEIKYTEAISSNSTRKLSWVEISKMLIAILKINKFILSFIIIFGTTFVPYFHVDKHVGKHLKLYDALCCT